MKNIYKFSMCAILLLFLTACFDSTEVKQVKGGVLQLCPNHTVDQMVKGFMGSPSWSSGKSADGKVFVNVEGDITFHNKPVRAMVQFIVQGENFSFSSFEMNGVPSANIIAIGLLNKMCESAVLAVASEAIASEAIASEVIASEVIASEVIASEVIASEAEPVAPVPEPETEDSSSKSETPERCVNREMAKWENQRELEIDKWCADLAKKGQECRISAGQDEAVRQETLGKITAQCG